MLQKQLENVLMMIRVACHYFFNWDECIINQVGLSCMLVVVLCRAWVVTVANGFASVGDGVKATVQRFREQAHSEHLFASIDQLRHRSRG